MQRALDLLCMDQRGFLALHWVILGMFWLIADLSSVTGKVPFGMHHTTPLLPIPLRSWTGPSWQVRKSFQAMKPVQGRFSHLLLSDLALSLAKMAKSCILRVLGAF